jgi:hypothetical protein
MAWFKKKPDLISDRAHTLGEEIAALEAQIQTLDSQLQRDRLRPQSPSAIATRDSLSPLYDQASAPAGAPIAHEPIFEEVRREGLQARAEGPTTPDHFNELGVRKYDLPALLGRLRNHFRGPSTTNPKLVSYLAAGGIQGLRPLRYEKRVARNRFIALVVVLLVILLGLIAAFVHR